MWSYFFVDSNFDSKTIGAKTISKTSGTYDSLALGHFGDLFMRDVSIYCHYYNYY